MSGSAVGPRAVSRARLTDPAVDLDALPPLDQIVLSHLHEDHFDRAVEKRLDKGIPTLTTPHAAAGLARKGFRAAQAVPAWESLTVTPSSSPRWVTFSVGRATRIRAAPGPTALRSRSSRGWSRRPPPTRTFTSFGGARPSISRCPKSAGADGDLVASFSPPTPLKSQVRSRAMITSSCARSHRVGGPERRPTPRIHPGEVARGVAPLVLGFRWRDTRLNGAG